MDADTLLARHKVRNDVLGCQSCSLASNCRNPVPFRGPSPVDIVVIGETPDEQEDKLGQPFIGVGGQLARSWVRDVGLEPDDLGWLNVVSCYPGRTPTSAEVQSCRPNVAAQLSVLQPKYVLLLGGIAVQSWWPKIRMGDIRGHWFQLNDVVGKPWAFPTWGVAAAVRNQTLAAEAAQDVLFFASVAKEGLQPHKSHSCVRCCQEAVEWVNNIPFCAVHDQSGVRRISNRKVTH